MLFKNIVILFAAISAVAFSMYLKERKTEGGSNRNLGKTFLSGFITVLLTIAAFSL